MFESDLISEHFENLGFEDPETEDPADYEDQGEYIAGGSEEEVANYVDSGNYDSLVDDVSEKVLRSLKMYLEDKETVNGSVETTEGGEDLVPDIQPIQIYYSAPAEAPAETVSSNQVFILNDEQFAELLQTIRETQSDNVPVVVQDSVSDNLIPVQNASEASFITNILIFGLLFGYMVKESLFRGV